MIMSKHVMNFHLCPVLKGVMTTWPINIYLLPKVPVILLVLQEL